MRNNLALTRSRPLKNLIVVLALVFTISAEAKMKAAKGCKKGYSKISCEEVEDAKRAFFCLKDGKEFNEEKKTKICKTERKKRKMKKNAKK